MKLRLSPYRVGSIVGEAAPRIEQPIRDVLVSVWSLDPRRIATDLPRYATEPPEIDPETIPASFDDADRAAYWQGYYRANPERTVRRRTLPLLLLPVEKRLIEMLREYSGTLPITVFRRGLAETMTELLDDGELWLHGEE